MRAAANRSRNRIDRRATVKEGDIAMRIVVDAMNKMASILSPAQSRLTGSAAAARIHKLVRRLTGIFLDPSRSWLRYEE
jgi:hypothetical protein